MIHVFAIALTMMHLLPWVLIGLHESDIEGTLLIITSAIIISVLVFSLTMAYPMLGFFFLFTAMYSWQTLIRNV